MTVVHRQTHDDARELVLGPRLLTLGEPAAIGLVVPLESHALAEHLRRDELEELLLHAPFVDALFSHETDA